MSRSLVAEPAAHQIPASATAITVVSRPSSSAKRTRSPAWTSVLLRSIAMGVMWVAGRRHPRPGRHVRARPDLPTLDHRTTRSPT